MRIANTVHDSIVDGQGLRFTVFTQGCPHRCPGCHNPGTHDPAGGREVSVAALVAVLQATTRAFTPCFSSRSAAAMDSARTSSRDRSP